MTRLLARSRMHLGVQGRGNAMKKHTTTRLTLARETIRQLTRSDYRAIVGGSTIVYTCDTTLSLVQTGQPTLGCPA